MGEVYAYSPSQNAYPERLIESIRREGLDHILVANERGLRRALNPRSTTN